MRLHTAPSTVLNPAAGDRRPSSTTDGVLSPAPHTPGERVDEHAPGRSFAVPDSPFPATPGPYGAATGTRTARSDDVVPSVVLQCVGGILRSLTTVQGVIVQKDLPLLWRHAAVAAFAGTSLAASHLAVTGPSATRVEGNGSETLAAAIAAETADILSSGVLSRYSTDWGRSRKTDRGTLSPGGTSVLFTVRTIASLMRCW